MRLSARHIEPAVNTSAGSPRPVRLRLGGLAYQLTSPEALGLATSLADAVAAIRNEPEGMSI